MDDSKQREHYVIFSKGSLARIKPTPIAPLRNMYQATNINCNSKVAPGNGKVVRVLN
jgi:hypothetical protein